eukprot:RCo005316
MEAEPALKEAFEASHSAYENYVRDLLPPAAWKEFRRFHIDAVPRKYGNGGVSCPSAVKCLHAQVAMYLAGLPNPIGEGVIREILREEGETMPACGPGSSVGTVEGHPAPLAPAAVMESCELCALCDRQHQRHTTVSV